MGMLGEDDETLLEAMTALGKKHVSFGVEPDWFPYMTKALIHVMKSLLPSFTKDEEVAFEHVMAVLIADLIRGQRTVNKDLAAAKKDIVTASWEKFSQIPDYEMKGGVRLFQQYVLFIFSLSPIYISCAIRPLLTCNKTNYSISPNSFDLSLSTTTTTHTASSHYAPKPNCCSASLRILIPMVMFC